VETGRQLSCDADLGWVRRFPETHGLRYSGWRCCLANAEAGAGPGRLGGDIIVAVRPGVGEFAYADLKQKREL